MRQSIKTFGIRLLLLIVVVIFLDQIGGRVLDHYYLKVRAGSEYKTIYGIEKSKEDLLIMGSSRAYHHYVTAMLEQSLGMEGYNLGRDGAGVLYHYAVYKTICDRKKPKMLLIDVNPDELMTRSVTYELLYQLLPHYDKNKYIKEIVNLRSPFEWLKVRSRLYRYNSQLFYIAVNNVKRPDVDASKGYLALEGNVKSKPEVVTWNTPEPDSVLLLYFEKFLEEARNNNTRVVVCISPIYKRYRDSAPSIVQVNRICEKQKVLVLDYSQDTSFLNHPEYFRDALHLNDLGAHLYTRRLIETLHNKNY